MGSDQEQLQRGHFLREAGALQRTNADGTHRLTRIFFPDAENASEAPAVLVTAITSDWHETTVRLPITATRDDLYAALTVKHGWNAPDPEALTRFPSSATDQPLLVYADLLDDLGDLPFLLMTYPREVGRPDVAPRLDAVGLADATTAVVEVSAHPAHRTLVPLDSGFSLTAVALAIADHLMTVRPSGDAEVETTWRLPNGSDCAGSQHGIYLHGFSSNHVSLGQSGPYQPDQEAALEQSRKSLKRLGAQHIVRVEAPDPRTAAELAEDAARTGGSGFPPEPRSAPDRIGRAAAVFGTKLAELRVRWRGR